MGPSRRLAPTALLELNLTAPLSGKWPSDRAFAPNMLASITERASD
jgi:hypothetical protein